MAGVNFTRPAAQRIADVVRAYEEGSRDGSAFDLGRRFQQAGGGKAIRMCTYTGSWGIDTFKTVTFKYQTTTPNTVTAVNLFLDLPDDGTKNCAIAKDGTAWHLIQWQWVTVSCTTATSSP